MTAFTDWDGTYEKQAYEVREPGGPAVACWPNAGFMLAMDGSARRWGPGEVQVRPAPWQEPGYGGEVPADAAPSCFVRRARP